MTERARRLGFTLVEVMVALVIGGMAVAGAGALLSGLGDRVQAIGRAAARADGDANGERLLRGLLANLELSTDTTARSFVGDANNATFGAWCDTPAGWLDHCTVHLFLDRQGHATVLRLQLGGANSSAIDLRRGFREGRFCYLMDVDGRLRWVDTWSQLVVPTGLAVIIDADTLFFPVWGGG